MLVEYTMNIPPDVDVSDMNNIKNWVFGKFLRPGETRQDCSLLFDADTVRRKLRVRLERLENTGIGDGSVLTVPHLGDKMVFTLTTSPRKSGTKKEFIFDDNERLKWLYTRQEQFGFKLHGKPEVVERKIPVNGKNRFLLNRVTFIGYLEVTDATKFEHMLTTGAGVNGCYGCGFFDIINIV